MDRRRKRDTPSRWNGNYSTQTSPLKQRITFCRTACRSTSTNQTRPPRTNQRDQGAMNQKRYAYLIGANGPQTEQVKALKYAHRDAQRLAEALLAPPCTFTKAEWTIAESPQPTLAGLNRLIKQCEPSDLLLVHFSGHGNYEGQLFLICNGTDIDDCLSSAIKVE